MQYAPILPTKAVGFFEPPSRCHFMFAEFAYISPGYSDYYYSRANSGPETPRQTVIMDTLVYEGMNDGNRVNLSALKETLKKVQPTYLIVPDVPEDMDGTIQAFSNIVVNSTIMGASPDTIPIGVIQGKNTWDAIHCANVLGALTDTLAIPTRSPGGIPRSRLLRMLIEDSGFTHHKFHLLGQAQTGFEDDIRCASFPQVMSLDSKKAVAAALQGINLRTLNELVRTTRQAILEMEDPTLTTPRAGLPTIHSTDDFFNWDPWAIVGDLDKPDSVASQTRIRITENIEVLTKWLA